MLTESLGFPVRPEDIWDNNYPEARLVDAARWGAWAVRGKFNISIFSWDRMGECVRNGFTVAEDGPASFEVHAKEAG
jgi:hypothetical protein